MDEDPSDAVIFVEESFKYCCSSYLLEGAPLSTKAKPYWKLISLAPYFESVSSVVEDFKNVLSQFSRDVLFPCTQPRPQELLDSFASLRDDLLVVHLPELSEIGGIFWACLP